jgi:regulator of cell morphogenesis and NO signaling
MEITSQDIIGDLVAKDYRSAAVFESFGIDFCCKGNRSIAEACDKKNLQPEVIISHLSHVLQQDEHQQVDYASWPADLLADYIEKKHHRYVQQKAIEIRPFLDKVVRVHGGKHPELVEIQQQFQDSMAELASHMRKEEIILFPFIRNMVKASMAGEILPPPMFGTVENPINMMLVEHNVEGERFEKIATLSNGYVPPADACNTYRVTFAMLQEFEQDLHLHIHLENNILFPAAIEMERSMSMLASAN